MTDYSKLSKFDIACRIATIIGLSVTKYEEHKEPYVWDEINNKEFDPCNNPSDAWPIIVDNKIDIEFAGDHLGSIGQAHVYIKGDTDIFCEFTDNKDALRSAMIVFLMMNEDKSC